MLCIQCNNRCEGMREVSFIRIQNKMPISNEAVHLELMKNEWVPMREPSNVGMAILFSLPIMILNALITIGAIYVFSSISLAEFGFSAKSITIYIPYGVIIWIFFLLITHELIHLLLIPNFRKSNKTFIGLTPFGGYVLTEEELSKSRYIMVTVAPFVIISIITPFLLSMFDLLTPTLKFLILLNSLASSVDILNFILILVQVPKRAKLVSNGTKTYWKKIEEKHL